MGDMSRLLELANALKDELSKEAKELEAPVNAYAKLLQINSDMDAAKEMSKDPEMGEFAKE